MGLSMSEINKESKEIRAFGRVVARELTLEELPVIGGAKKAVHTCVGGITGGGDCGESEDLD